MAVSYADKFKYTTASSPSYGVSSGTFPLNPIDFDWQQKDLYTLVDIMDGEAVRQKPLHDKRIRKMIWRGWPLTNSSIMHLLNILDKLKGKQFWFIDGSVGYFSEWTECRGLNIIKTYQPGPGKARYNEIIFEFLVIDSGWSGY